LKGSLNELPPQLAGMPVKLEEAGTRIRFEDQKDVITRVLKAVHDLGMEVEKIDVRRPTLEDAFLKLTGKSTPQLGAFKI
jgi:hypothetical protein